MLKLPPSLAATNANSIGYPHSALGSRLTADLALGEKAKALLLNAENKIYVSAARIWEVAIKHQKNPKVMTIGPDVLINACSDSGFNWLDVSVYHARTTAQLPLLHSDPFDRLLKAQAIQEPMHLLTRDQQLVAYSELVQLV
jgi:PIN domain nuclease of toxin-antitoxin system